MKKIKWRKSYNNVYNILKNNYKHKAQLNKETRTKYLIVRNMNITNKD